jgi:hypothetical protein
MQARVACKRIVKISGRLLVHGGFEGKAVSADTHVLEVQAFQHARPAHSRHASLTAEAQSDVDKALEGGDREVAQHHQGEAPPAAQAPRSPVAGACLVQTDEIG